MTRRIAIVCTLVGAWLLLAALALAQNRPPVADAGPDQYVYTHTGSVLGGRPTGADSDTIVGWLWTIESQPVGSLPYLCQPESRNTGFTCDVAGDYMISPITSDDLARSAPDFVTIHVTGLPPPVAIATADVTNGPAPLTVHSDASQSYDSQGGALFIDRDFGDQTAGSYELSPALAYQSPGGYLAWLTVVDDLSQVSTDTIPITLGDPPAPAFKIESSAFNAGGHPDDGTILTSSSYRMTLDALGDSAGAVALGSASWRMDAGLSPGYGPPGEVMNLRFDDATTLHWDAKPSAVLYHVYDGDTCVPPDLAQTTATISAIPAPGGLFTYLVTAENTLGEEGTRGYWSDHTERPNPNACP